MNMHVFLVIFSLFGRAALLDLSEEAVDGLRNLGIRVSNVGEGGLESFHAVLGGNGRQSLPPPTKPIARPRTMLEPVSAGGLDLRLGREPSPLLGAIFERFLVG